MIYFSDVIIGNISRFVPGLADFLLIISEWVAFDAT